MSTETYFESAADVTITRDRAVKEIAKHSGGVAHYAAEMVIEFYRDMGIHDEYPAQAVLAWLGY